MLRVSHLCISGADFVNCQHEIIRCVMRIVYEVIKSTIKIDLFLVIRPLRDHCLSPCASNNSNTKLVVISAISFHRMVLCTNSSALCWTIRNHFIAFRWENWLKMHCIVFTIGIRIKIVGEKTAYGGQIKMMLNAQCTIIFIVISILSNELEHSN